MLKGALVGFGKVAEFGHWPGYAATGEVEIVAVVDPSPARRERAAALRPSLGVFATLDQIDFEAIDFVDICTPPAVHVQPMLEALARGWHVLCEKPFLLEQSLVEKVREQACRKNLAVIPVHNWKYAPIIRCATGRLRAGEIGELRELTITTLRTQAAATVDPAERNWRLDPALAGGGILMDHGWHATYLALAWLGEAPTSAEAELHWRSDSGIDDEAVVTLQFPSGSAHLELSWNATNRSNQMRLKGTRGEILIDDDKLEVNGRVTHFGSALSAGSHHPDWFAAMLPDVISSLKNPAQSRATFEDAAVCLTTINAAYLQSQSQLSARR